MTELKGKGTDKANQEPRERDRPQWACSARQRRHDRQRPIHQVEEAVFRNLLVIGHWLLRAFLDRAGTGDVGPTLTVATDPPSEPDQELPRLEQLHKRPYLSIFGEIEIERTCYGHD